MLTLGKKWSLLLLPLIQAILRFLHSFSLLKYRDGFVPCNKGSCNCGEIQILVYWFSCWKGESCSTKKKKFLSVRVRCSKQRSNPAKISCVVGLLACCLADPSGTLLVPEWRSCHCIRLTVCTEAQLMLSCNCFLNAENSNKAHMHACTYMLTAMLRLMEISQIANPVWNQKFPSKTSAHWFGQQS